MIGPIDGSLSLRRAGPADENFRKNLFYEARRPIFEPLDLPERETVRLLEMQWAARLADYSARYPNLEAIIVQNGTDSVGCLLVDLGDVVTVVDICIQREHRGQGTGARVLAALLNRADHEGLPVQLVVEESNPASRLYRRLGFEETGRNGTSLAMRREPQDIPPGSRPPAILEPMCRVLVIDDETDVLLAVSRRLEREGYEVTPAANSEQGIEKILTAPKPYDVVVTDMSMENPGSGLEVLQAAFSRDLFAEVIVMTAYGSVGNAVECMRRGAFDYIEKNVPGVDAYELLAIKIGQAMEQRRRDLRTVQQWERAAESKARMP